MTVMEREDVAAALKITTRTLQRWVASGYFPSPGRIGRRAVYDRMTVEDWINNQTKRGNDED